MFHFLGNACNISPKKCQQFPFWRILEGRSKTKNNRRFIVKRPDSPPPCVADVPCACSKGGEGTGFKKLLSPSVASEGGREPAPGVVKMPAAKLLRAKTDAPLYPPFKPPLFRSVHDCKFEKIFNRYDLNGTDFIFPNFVPWGLRVLIG